MNKSIKKEETVVEIMTDIVEEKPINQIIKYDVTDAILSEAAERIGKMKCTDKEERQALGKEIQTLVASRTGIKERQKELQKPAKEYINRVKEEGERLLQRVFDIETPAKEKRDEWDLVEKERIAEKKRIEDERIQKIQDKITSIKELVVECAGETICFISEAISSLKEIQITDEEYFELAPRAELTKMQTLESLNAMLEKKQEEAEIAAQAEKERVAAQLAAEEARKKLEAEQAKLAEERKKQEEFAKKEADKLAKEREKMEADKKKADDLAEKKLAEMAEESRRLEAEKAKLQEAQEKQHVEEVKKKHTYQPKKETKQQDETKDIPEHEQGLSNEILCTFCELHDLGITPEQYKKWYEAQ